MKVLAIHLPAFHRIAENDKWWGEGFTEWDNVKKGIPLFGGHNQPEVPLKGYYDLSKKEAIEQQVKLASEYGVDGFIYYHYWFSGKKLFEKPCEILLENKEIKTEFCFCWANEPWSRTWSGKDSELLMAQNYGGKEDWIEHIEYLYSFLSDDRYIKIEGHPVLFVYSPSTIPQFDKMITLWNEYLSSKGLNSIYLIEYISSKNIEASSRYSNGIMEFEPLYTTRFDISAINKFKRLICKKLKKTDYQDYDKLWSYILKRERLYGDRTIFKSCFSGWDNSPRKGKNSMIVRYGSPEKFGQYFEKLINQNRKNASKDFIIINAWNEWGEGAMLEPTISNGCAYLNQIKKHK